MRRLQKMFQLATKALTRRQQRYKKAFDASIKTRRRAPRVGDYLFVRHEQTQERKPWHKLAPKALGPFPLVKVSDYGRSITVQYSDEVETLNSARVELEPPTDSATAENEDEEATTTPPPEEDLEYVLDSFIDNYEMEGRPDNYWVVNVKWYNYKETTWEPLKNVYYSQVAKYCFRNGLAHPANMSEARKD